MADSAKSSTGRGCRQQVRKVSRATTAPASRAFLPARRLRLGPGPARPPAEPPNFFSYKQKRGSIAALLLTLRVAAAR
jgi:hypothetical protein